jgi:hypothetical protein
MVDIDRWKALTELCEEVSEGAVTIKQFHAAWPQGLESSALAEAIFEDLEDGVEHFPGKWSGRPDWESWKASDMYRRIVLDLQILQTGLDESRQMDIRDSVIADRSTPLDELVSRVTALSIQPKQ